MGLAKSGEPLPAAGKPPYWLPRSLRRLLRTGQQGRREDNPRGSLEAKEVKVQVPTSSISLEPGVLS